MSCCDKEKEKFEGKNKRLSKSCSLGKVCNPIAEEVKDPLDMDYMVRGLYRYIPLYELGDATYAFWRRMASLSPTHGSIINNIGRYAFGGGLTVNKKGDGFSESQKAEITPAQIEEYKTFVKSWTDPNALMEAAREAYSSYKIWGNAGAVVTISRVAGQVSVQYKTYDADQFRYMAETQNAPIKYMVIAPSFDRNTLQNADVDLVPVYPAFEENNGVKRTFIHLKNKVAGRTWYGEPDSRQSIHFQYLEYQLGQFTTQGYRKGWTAKAIIEQYGDLEDETGDEDFRRALAGVYTNEGEANQIAIRTIGEGTSPMSVHNFPANTDHQFHQTMSDIASSKIYVSHDWHPILNEKTPGSLGNSQEFKNVFKVKYYTVIQPMQEKIMALINTICAIAEAELMYENPDGLALGVNSLFMDMLKDEQVADPLGKLSGGLA